MNFPGSNKLTLTDAAFTGTNITVTAKPSTNGDGQVNIGAIHLDALRHRNAERAEIAVIAPPSDESLDDLL